MPVLDRPPQRRAGREQPLLADELVERLRPQPRRQRRVRGGLGALARTRAARPCRTAAPYVEYEASQRLSADDRQRRRRGARPLLASASPPSAVATPPRSVKRPPASSTITGRRGEVPQPTPRVERDLDGALGDEHVLPEVAESARAPAARERARAARPRRPSCLPRRRARRTTAGRRPARRTAETRRRRGLGEAVGDVRAGAPRRPPAPAERGRRDHADRQLAARPGARSASPTPGSRGRSSWCRRSDRGSTDAAASSAPRGAVLLAEHGVIRPGRREPVAQRALDGGVGLGHRRHVRLASRPSGRRRRNRSRVIASAMSASSSASARSSGSVATGRRSYGDG